MLKKILNYELLKEIVNTTYKYSTEIVFTYKKEGIQISCLDPANVCGIIGFIPKSEIKNYRIKKDFSFAVNGTNLLKLFLKTKKAESVSIFFDNKKEFVNFTVKTSEYREFAFTTKMLVYEVKPFNIPKDMIFPSNIEVRRNSMIEVIEKSYIVGDSMKISQKDSRVIFSTEGNDNTLHITENGIGKGNANAKYSLEYLRKFFSNKKTSFGSTFVLEFNNEYPIKATISNDGAYMTMLLAPRVEDE
jgi:hypothetical protein